MIHYTPLEPLSNGLLLKRDDLIHPIVQGNKWRKLSIVLSKWQRDGTPGFITFGGPFSNHLHAAAAAGPMFNLATVGIIRGTAADMNNPTLSFARNRGMNLIPIPKRDYDAGMASGRIQEIVAQFPDYAVLPEGGASPGATKGCMGIGLEILRQLPPEASGRPLFVAIPAGTGCTAAGMIAGLEGQGTTLVFPATLEGIDEARIKAHLREAGAPEGLPFQLIRDYTFGGFAAHEPLLVDFARRFRAETGVLLDPIYTVKMLYGLYDLLEKGFFPAESVVVAVHTGGLQGWDGFRQRFGVDI